MSGTWPYVIAAWVIVIGAFVGYAVVTVLRGLIPRQQFEVARCERVEAVGNQEGYWPGAPDMAVEVVSPNDIYTEVEEKVFDWLDAGARLVVVLNPRKRAVTAYRSLERIVVHTESETLDCSDVVPGFSIAVRDIFK